MPSSRESARRRSRAAWPSSKWRASPAGLPARGGPRAHLRGSALFLAGEHRKLLNRVRVARSPKVLPLPDGDPLREQGHGRRPSHPASARLRGAEGAPRPQSSVTRWTPASLPRISRPRLTPHLSLPKGAWLLGAGPRREAVGRQRAAAAATWLATPASDRLPRRRAPSAVSRRIRCGSSRRSNSRRARPRRPSWAGARPARPEARNTLFREKDKPPRHFRDTSETQHVGSRVWVGMGSPAHTPWYTPPCESPPRHATCVPCLAPTQL
mmetsp:Transcript_5720/g.18709  ORF Transcript_5720/g.18709 Transcript_5720/m.18709 type:complete len:268 (+) Transcript_5720:289-1092(+)